MNIVNRGRDLRSDVYRRESLKMHPFTDEDFSDCRLPESLRPYKKKLFGLTINPKNLCAIRNERRPNSQYANFDQCKREIYEVESMYRHEQIPYLNSTHFSIEEIVTKIMSIAGIKRRL